MDASFSSSSGGGSFRHIAFCCRIVMTAAIALAAAFLLLFASGGTCQQQSPPSPSNSSSSSSNVSIGVSYGGQMVQNGSRLQPWETPFPPGIYVDAGSDNNGQASYAVAMIDRRASRQPGSAMMTYVHYWVVVLAQGWTQPARVGTIIAPYVRPAPHDSLEHPYEFHAYEMTNATTRPPLGFLLDRYVENFESLIQNQEPLASTVFTEQIQYP